MYRNIIIALLFFLILITFSLINCDDNGHGYVDEKGFEINGVVLDTASQLPIEDVIVGFYCYSDTIYFDGDSLNINHIVCKSRTNDLGAFRISDIGSINIQDFQQMIAWKNDYYFWCYADKPVPVNEIGESSYEMTIFLTKSQN